MPSGFMVFLFGTNEGSFCVKYLVVIRREASGLPFFSVIMMPNLPTSASLPLATLQETRSKIESGISRGTGESTLLLFVIDPPQYARACVGVCLCVCGDQGNGNSITCTSPRAINCS